MEDKEEKRLDELAISEWDEKFDEIKEKLAGKYEIFRQLYEITNERCNGKKMLTAVKTVENAARKINQARGQLRGVVRLFVYDASLRIFGYYWKRNWMKAEEAQQCAKDYQGRKKQLPDLLDENFFKDIMTAIDTWQT